MDELKLRNKLQKFTFFVDEDGQFGVRITSLKDKPIAQVMMSKKDVNDIILFIDENYDDIV